MNSVSMTGYEALHQSVAWIELSDRGRIKVTGEDRLHFIHAMSTNDVEMLAPGEGIETLFLNTQGQIQADVRVFVMEDHLLLDCDRDGQDALIAHLRKYIVMDDVILEDIAPSTAAISLEGPESERVADELTGGALPPSGAWRHRAHGAVRIARASVTGKPGFLFFLRRDDRELWVRRFETAGATRADPDAWRTVRMENGIPTLGRDYGADTIPQQAGRMSAVSFTKGCYLGQEIVERVRSRGNLRRKLVELVIDSAEPPAPDSAVFSGGQEVGRLTSAVFSPTMGRVSAFAMLRTKVPSGETLNVHGQKARVRR